MAAKPLEVTEQECNEQLALRKEPQALTPIDILQRAVDQNVDVEKLEKLLQVAERWEQTQARKAFVAAMNAFKEHPPTLEKVKKVDFSSKGGNRVHYNYAPLDYVAKQMSEALSSHGLSFRWDVSQNDGRITVTCILQHEAGHSEKVSLTAGLHDDDRMNAIQRLGSTVTYLQRYTLLASTGMATEEQDTDAGNAVTMGDLAERLEWIENSGTLDELKKIYTEAFMEAKKAGDQNAMNSLVAAKNKRYKELA